VQWPDRGWRTLEEFQGEFAASNGSVLAARGQTAGEAAALVAALRVAGLTAAASAGEGGSPPPAAAQTSRQFPPRMPQRARAEARRGSGSGSGRAGDGGRPTYDGALERRRRDGLVPSTTYRLVSHDGGAGALFTLELPAVICAGAAGQTATWNGSARSHLQRLEQQGWAIAGAVSAMRGGERGLERLTRLVCDANERALVAHVLAVVQQLEAVVEVEGEDKVAEDQVEEGGEDDDDNDDDGDDDDDEEEDEEGAAPCNDDDRTRRVGDGVTSDPQSTPCAVLVQLWDKRTKPLPDKLLG
jgi:hypothetical protein